MNIEDVRADIAAFADDVDEVVVTETGELMFVRNGADVTCRVEVTPHGETFVRLEDGRSLPYSKFLTHELARLDSLAHKFLQRPFASQLFVDGDASISRPAEDGKIAKSTRILREECEQVPPFSSRVAFVTADAGHGKTALLRHYQSTVAQEFINGETSYLFWHVDLQGRQLLRLSEALMGDLADIRHTGLWMAGVIRLLRARKLVLAVDGFDELSAEQGGSDALGALTGLVSQMEGQGVVIAAARRTFFDAEDYVRKTALIRRTMAQPCQFDQLELKPWSSAQAIEYLAAASQGGRGFENATVTYEEILSALGNNPAHPMLARPFLLAQVAKGMLISGFPASEFVRSGDDLHSGVEAVVNAFIRREVTEKWKSATTGEPYLTISQHMELLATVAEEMHRNQKERLGLDVIETLTAVLMDQWSIDPSRRPQIIEMVKSHVLLVLPSDGDGNYRSFDHPEFRDYFIAYALRSYLETSLWAGDTRQLVNSLSFAPLSDGTARYVCSMVARDPELVGGVAVKLAADVARDWRPSHIHTNVGTLLAFLVSGIAFDDPIELDAALIYTSLVFENASLTNVVFRRSTFVNLSLRGSSWRDVALVDCEINELTLDADSSSFANVRFVDTRVMSVRVIRDGEEIAREYAPSRVRQTLEKVGARMGDDQPELPEVSDLDESEIVRVAKRFLRMFSRSTSVSDAMIEHRFNGGGATAMILTLVIPCAERHGIIESKAWKGSGNQRIWTLRREIDVVLAAEDASSGPEYEFWRDLRSFT